MINVKFLLPNGEEMTVEAHDGWSVMEAARKFDVPGIVAECGGGATCSTCHVYVDAPWSEQLPPADDLETALLELAPGHDPARSRLSCQLILDGRMDGITVAVPEEQYGY